METGRVADDLEQAVREFADDWLRLARAGVGERLVADPILVLGPQGTSPVPRPAFVAAVRARQDAVDSAPTPTTVTLTGLVATPLGEQMVVATMNWSFGPVGSAAQDPGEGASRGTTTLVSDFLLERVSDGGLRCVAYLPRTNVMNHVG